MTQYLESKHQEVFIRQEYMPGEICEFDWGTVKLDIGDSGYQKYQITVFASVYGNFRFVKLYLSQDTAAFQESHADFFAYSHGAFQTMVYDNMKVAVRHFVGLTEKSTAKADKYSTVTVARNHYSVPDTFVGKQLDVRLYMLFCLFI